MSTPLGSEPAFPRADPNSYGNYTAAAQDGMSTRTWLAGTIAAGLAAGPQSQESWEAMANRAVAAADALLASLAAVPPQGIPSTTQGPPAG